VKRFEGFLSGTAKGNGGHNQKIAQVRKPVNIPKAPEKNSAMLTLDQSPTPIVLNNMIRFMK
jgi:hypothetical protein